MDKQLDKPIGFRVDGCLYDYLKEEADKRHASLSWYIRDILYAHVGGEDAKD